MTDISVTPTMLRELRKSLHQSLSEFGWTLKRTIHPKTTTPFSSAYIAGLESGRKGFAITSEIQSAFYYIAASHDAQRPELQATVLVAVYALPDQIPANTYVPRTVKTHRCEYPGCDVTFIKASGTQRYHVPPEMHGAQKEKPGHMGMSGRPRKG